LEGRLEEGDARRREDALRGEMAVDALRRRVETPRMEFGGGGGAQEQRASELFQIQMASQGPTVAAMLREVEKINDLLAAKASLEDVAALEERLRADVSRQVDVRGGGVLHSVSFSFVCLTKAGVDVDVDV
jgi:hypothetical protein